MNGVWAVYYNDWHTIVRAVFVDELEARRYAMETYSDVVWLPVGMEISEALAASRAA